jgi:hypothetical protein
VSAVGRRIDPCGIRPRARSTFSASSSGTDSSPARPWPQSSASRRGLFAGTWRGFAISAIRSPPGWVSMAAIRWRLVLCCHPSSSASMKPWRVRSLCAGGKRATTSSSRPARCRRCSARCLSECAGSSMPSRRSLSTSPSTGWMTPTRRRSMSEWWASWRGRASCIGGWSFSTLGTMAGADLAESTRQPS